ncbi:MAG: outer membrane protein assembly factor BamD [Myxococcota bacterium]|nr:outer membrane protein assembly factor BamD [Myxococcota bacterium]
MRSLISPYALLFITFVNLGCGSQAPERYQDSAAHFYELAVAALEDDDFISATDHFRTVHTKYVYSRYAPLAEVGEADTDFAQESYALAIEKYQTFIQKRPNHERVPYAFWKIAESYFLQRPTDNFILPPTYEKDLSPSKDALRALRAYLQRYPEGEFRARADKARLSCLQTLAAHELYVADFYLQRDQPGAARGRLERVIADYRAFPSLWSDAAWRLVQVLERLEERSAARALATKVLAETPKQPAAEEVKEWLARRQETSGEE